MNYLRKKLQAIMASADFKGYLREVTGTDSVTLTDCMGSDMTSLSLVGNAVQDGTPSPDNPVEIQGCGDRTANLFDIHAFSDYLDDNVPGEIHEFIDLDGENVFKFNGNGMYNSSETKFFSVDCKENTQYTFSCKALGSGVEWLPETAAIFTFEFKYSDGTATGTSSSCIVRNSSSWVDISFTTPVGKTLIGIYGYRYNGTFGYIKDVCLREGAYAAETMPPYEPYGYKVPVEVSGNGDTQTFNIYTDKPLYGQDGEPWSEVVYDGTEGWHTNSTSDDGTMIKYFLASQTKVGAVGARECACTHYPKTTISSTPWFEQDTCRAWGFVSQKGWFGICVNAADYPTVDDWKAFLQAQYAAGTPVKAYFAAEGSAPAETKVPTYKGTTIITADTTIQPSSMTAQYYATKKEED